MIFQHRGPLYSQDGNPAPAPAPTPAPADPAPIPYGRFREVNDSLNAAKARIADLEREAQTLTQRAATADTLAAQVAEWKTKHAEAEGRFSTFTEFSGALGTSDADVIEAFNSKYKSLPEKERPSRADWIKGLREKPDDAPALLRPFLGATQAQTPKPGQPAPRIPGQPATPTTPAQSVTPEQIKAAREKALATGKWDDYKALRKAMGYGDQ